MRASRGRRSQRIAPRHPPFGIGVRHRAYAFSRAYCAQSRSTARRQRRADTVRGVGRACGVPWRRVESTARRICRCGRHSRGLTRVGRIHGHDGADWPNPRPVRLLDQPALRLAESTAPTCYGTSCWLGQPDADRIRTDAHVVNLVRCELAPVGAFDLGHNDQRATEYEALAARKILIATRMRLQSQNGSRWSACRENRGSA